MIVMGGPSANQQIDEQTYGTQSPVERLRRHHIKIAITSLHERGLVFGDDLRAPSLDFATWLNGFCFRKTPGGCTKAVWVHRHQPRSQKRWPLWHCRSSCIIVGISCGRGKEDRYVSAPLYPRNRRDRGTEVPPPR